MNGPRYDREDVRITAFRPHSIGVSQGPPCPSDAVFQRFPIDPTRRSPIEIRVPASLFSKSFKSSRKICVKFDLGYGWVAISAFETDIAIGCLGPLTVSHQASPNRKPIAFGYAFDRSPLRFENDLATLEGDLWS